MLTIGVPKEIKLLEKRVGLTPSAVGELTRQGIKVFIENGAGKQSGFSDSDYQRSGAEMVPDAKFLYRHAQIIQKVKEPLAPEFPLLRKEHLLFCFLHLASPENCGLVNVLLKSQATAIGYETLEKNGKLLLLAPMSQIAGGLSAAYAACMRKMPLESGGRIVYPSDFHARLNRVAQQYPDFKNSLNAGEVVIFGGGVAGQKAMEVASALKGKVVVIEKNEERRNFLKKFTPYVYSPDENILNALESADVLIGCVHVRGERALKVMNDTQLETISRGKKKIIMDVAIDQGGNFPQAHSTDYEDPIYLDTFGNIRFSVANIPSFCGRAASEALSEISWIYSAALSKDPAQAFRDYPELQAAVNIQAGRVKIETIREVHQK